MKLYIPPHLKDFEIFGQLESLIKGYSSYYASSTSSFEDYNTNLASDPVVKFLNICIPSENIESTHNYEDVINYLAKLFYSVKGTVKIFEYMEKYLNLGLSESIVFSTESIKIDINSINTSNKEAYLESLRGFLDALIYYRGLNLKISDINLVIEGNLKGWVGLSSNTYKEITLTEFTD